MSGKVIFAKLQLQFMQSVGNLIPSHLDNLALFLHKFHLKNLIISIFNAICPGSSLENIV